MAFIEERAPCAAGGDSARGKGDGYGETRKNAKSEYIFIFCSDRNFNCHYHVRTVAAPTPNTSSSTVVSHVNRRTNEKIVKNHIPFRRKYENSLTFVWLRKTIRPPLIAHSNALSCVEFADSFLFDCNHGSTSDTGFTDDSL